MIIRPGQNWFRMLFVWRGSVLQSIIPQLSFVGALSVLAVFTHGRIFGEKIPLSTAPFTLFGLALAIFLAFRNNASYARFIEARHLWGSLLISARTLTSQVLNYVPNGDSQDDRRIFSSLLIAFVYVLKHQLRRTDPSSDMERLLGKEQARLLNEKNYKPVDILNRLRQVLVALQRDTGYSDMTRWILNEQLVELGKVVGGCERIASTPIPFAYSVLLHRTVYAYCVLLPFGLVDSTELFTPLLCVFIAYTLIALEAIANEVAEPFGLAPNALALDAMARTIERSVLELCEFDVPDELLPGESFQLT
ncbi:bestrophin family ion channel [Crenobacter sp. SG2305]|uniref:bestrophin family protein n=1 Tax=Crenobacter oryzisoli TaxID=3056844 RepID=UPI0025AA9023|nr:bestrophin family ion channel [Crenobacter sp. SG2305]MDN0081930.1 bestrophin family ion channel [Crenobacter sp. SG2305]